MFLFQHAYMLRTSILLPESLKKAADRVARARGLSLGGLIRHQLDLLVGSESRKGKVDPLFDDFRPYAGKAPRDLAERHDAYLYGEIEP
jgi:hypothetical protein